MGTKVEVKTIPLHGLFIHRKQVWRSLGKLRAESHSTSAQKVFMNEHNTEVSTENVDFIDGLKVTTYDGELPRISKYVGSISYYQYCLMQKNGLVMEDLPIGSEIVLKVVESETEECNGCFFDEISSNIYENICKDICCAAIDRKDKKNVQFKRVK